jgi:drug/metabolite transporter (DMT)-like permease
MPGIFFAKTGPEPTADNYALAYAQRRSWIMWSWLYGAILAAAGAVYAIVSQMVGEDSETGVIMALLGLAFAALGWLASAAKRFSRKIPKPAMDLARAEQAIRINRPVVIVSNIVMAVLILAAAFGTPKGLSPESLPVLAMLSVVAPLLGIGMVRTKKLLVERGSRYDLWLLSR